jgi:hypothetical protein
MSATINPLSLDVVRAEAAFVSALQPSDAPDPERVRRVVTITVREFGVAGCAARVAQEFGDHPELAVARMRWARLVVEAAFAPVRSTPRRSFTPSVAAAVAHAA